MDILNIFHIFTGTLIVIYLSLFSYNLIDERQYMAFVKVVFILIIFGLYWFVYGLMFSSELEKVINITLIYSFLFLFFIPIRKKVAYKIQQETNENNKVDERDTMFARAELKPNTENYKIYYHIHSEKKQIDDKIRSMTPLLEPGGKYYDKAKSELVKTLFEIEESRINEVDGEISKEKQVFTSQEATDWVKNKCLELGADEVGIALLNQNYVYSHQARGTKPWGTPIENHHKFVVSFSVEMNFDSVNKAPKIDTTIETANKYLLAQNISINLAKEIRQMGYSARAHITGSNYEIMLPPVAYEAGLGELGRMNYIISKKFGARIRLGAVTTDLELNTDKPINFGVREFCNICLKCADNCPSGSVSRRLTKRIREVEKWEFNIEQCYSYWRYLGTDCGICMKVCPFSHKNNIVHNIIRLGISNSVFARYVSLWGDNIIYGKRTN